MDIKTHILFPKMYWSTQINLDILKLQEEAYQIKDKLQGVSKSNQGDTSYHSPDITDIGDKKVLKYLMGEIYKCVLAIHQNKKEGGIELCNFWININNKGGSNLAHTHPLSMYSGVYFIKIPTNTVQAGQLIFHRDFSESFIYQGNLGKFKEGYKKHDSDLVRKGLFPIEKMLIIFPSWIPHSVSVNETNEDRISLSFNFRCKY